MTKVLAAALGALAAACFVPAAAHAAPVCKNLSGFDTPPGKSVVLPIPDCTGIVGQATTTILMPPGHGSLTPAAPFTYTPTPGFHGVDELRYIVVDQNGASNQARVLIAVDTRPTCKDTSATVEGNRSVRIAYPCDDVDADDPVYISFSQGTNGSVVFDEGTADLIYTPKPGFSGTDSFTYYAEDEIGLETEEYRATITVSPAAPILIPGPPARVPTPTPPADVTAPVATLKSAAKPLKQTLSKGLAVLLGTNEASSVKFTVTVDKATARKLKLDRKAKGPVTVGTVNAALTPGSSPVTIAWSAKAKRALKSVKKLKVVVTAVVSDAAGNQVTKTLTVNLKR